jgi:Flp pilus assembly protein TadB
MSSLEETSQLKDRNKELPKFVDAVLRKTSAGRAFQAAVAGYG